MRRALDGTSYMIRFAPRTFEPGQEKAFRANDRARAFWQGQPAGYRRTATFWVTSARREETRARRLATLIETPNRATASRR